VGYGSSNHYPDAGQRKIEEAQLIFQRRAATRLLPRRLKELQNAVAIEIAVLNKLTGESYGY
jgi:hypothetical protein